MARARPGTSQLANLLATCQRPIYVLDDERRIAYCNATCAEWLGMETQEMIGTRCDYHAGEGRGERLDLAAALCPPPEAFAGQRCSAWVLRRDASGQAVHRRAEFLPLGDGDPEPCGVIVVLNASDERERPAPIDDVRRSSSDLHDLLRLLNCEVRERYRPERLAGDSPAMKRVREQVQLAVAGYTNVVIIGPPGSGREHVARTIHGGSAPHAAGPLMPLACPVIDAELLQNSVLALLRRCKEEPCERAASLLLLDIDQLEADAQAELLAFFRLPTFNLRAIVTSRRKPLDLATDRQFLGELAYHLSTLVIELPHLAERRQDIPLLAQQLLEEHNTRRGAQFTGFTPEALDQLAVLPWPGNVDELSLVVEQACDAATGPIITEAELPQHVKMAHSAAAHPRRERETIDLDAFLADIERELIRRAMRGARGNKAQAARLLGIHRGRLLRRLTQLGLSET